MAEICTTCLTYDGTLSPISHEQLQILNKLCYPKTMCLNNRIVKLCQHCDSAIQEVIMFRTKALKSLDCLAEHWKNSAQRQPVLEISPLTKQTLQKYLVENRASNIKTEECREMLDETEINVKNEQCLEERDALEDVKTERLEAGSLGHASTNNLSSSVVKIVLQAESKGKESNSDLSDSNNDSVDAEVTEDPEKNETTIKCVKAQWYTAKLDEEEIVAVMEQNRQKPDFLEAKYKCLSCAIVFPDESMFRKHNDAFHDEAIGPFCCTICTSRFSGFNELSKHRTIHSTTAFFCTCGFKTYSKKDIITHGRSTGRMKRCERMQTVPPDENGTPIVTDRPKQLKTYTNRKINRSGRSGADNLISSCGKDFSSNYVDNNHDLNKEDIILPTTTEDETSNDRNLSLEGHQNNIKERKLKAALHHSESEPNSVSTVLESVNSDNNSETSSQDDASLVSNIRKDDLLKPVNNELDLHTVDTVCLFSAEDESNTRNDTNLSEEKSYNKNKGLKRKVELPLMSEDETNTRCDINISDGKLQNKNRRRKRKAVPENWKKNKAKMLRNSGKPYISNRTGKLVEGRKLKPPCQETCRWKCFSKINEEKRRLIFQSYWNTGEFKKQRQFINQCMTEIKPKYQYIREGYTRKDYNNAFSFEVDNKRVRVCKKFFLNTLGVSERTIRTVKEKQKYKSGVLEDGRGRHKKKKSIDRSAVDESDEHISIPPISRKELENMHIIQSDPLNVAIKSEITDSIEDINDVFNVDAAIIDYEEDSSKNNGLLRKQNDLESKSNSVNAFLEAISSGNFLLDSEISSDDDASLIFNNRKDDILYSINEKSDLNTEDSALPFVYEDETNIKIGDGKRQNKNKKRKRKAVSENRKNNSAKMLRNSGKPYISSTSRKLVEERKMKPPCQEKCRWKCFSKINEEKRQLIFHSFWNTGDLEKQRQFINKCMTVIIPKYRYLREDATRKNYNHAFSFEIDNETVRVCKIFFLNTLDISYRRIRTVIEKQQSKIGLYDGRGKYRRRKMTSSVIDGLKEHIDSIPSTDSTEQDNMQRNECDILSETIKPEATDDIDSAIDEQTITILKMSSSEQDDTQTIENDTLCEFVKLEITDSVDEIDDIFNVNGEKFDNEEDFLENDELLFKQGNTESEERSVSAVLESISSDSFILDPATGSFRESQILAKDDPSFVSRTGKDFLKDNINNNSDGFLKDLPSTSLKDKRTTRNYSNLNRAKEKWKENKERKNKAVPENWKRNEAKMLRNSGKAYFSTRSKKLVEGRKMKPPCENKCKLKCFNKLGEEKRRIIFQSYWNTGELKKQRQFINKCMTEIKPKYRYIREGGRRKDYNHAFSFEIDNERVRVCKRFFVNTLGVSDRTIRTVIEKKKSNIYAFESDFRGKHKRH